MSATRSGPELPLKEIDLSDKAVLEAIAKAAPFESSNLHQKQLRSILTPHFYFYICANQFRKSHIPAEIEVDEFGYHECKTPQEVREFLPVTCISDEALQKASFPYRIPSPIPTKVKVPLDAKAVNTAIEKLSSSSPQFLHDMVTAFHKKYAQSAASLDSSYLLEKVLRYFRDNKHKYQALAKQYGLPVEALVQVVLPEMLAHQAKKHIDSVGGALAARYPLIKELFYSAKKTVFSPKEDTILVKFFDEKFPHYDANRVVHPDSKLSVFGGPITDFEVASLFEASVFNEIHPIHHMIVVGEVTKDEVTKDAVTKNNVALANFVNYFLWPAGTVLSFGRYECHIEEITEDALGLQKSSEAKQLSDEGCSATIKLKIIDLETKKEGLLTVDFFKAPVDQPLNLSHPQDFERFYQLLKKIDQQEVAIHSSATSANRAGQVVLMLELAKHLKRHEVRITLSNLSKQIDWVMKSIRSYNPHLICKENFFREAIKQSCLLYHYAQSLSHSWERIRSATSASVPGLETKPYVSVPQNSRSQGLGVQGYFAPPRLVLLTQSFPSSGKAHLTELPLNPSGRAREAMSHSGQSSSTDLTERKRTVTEGGSVLSAGGGALFQPAPAQALQAQPKAQVVSQVKQITPMSAAIRENYIPGKRA